MKDTRVHDIEFSLWGWDDLEKATTRLADAISESGQSYDRIIALANGGLTMARFLGDRLGTNKISSVQLSFYQGINDVKKKPQIIQPLTADVTDQNILIFEDIVDTGATLELAYQYLNEHGIRSMQTAALVVKPWSTIQPEYKGTDSKSWIIFPYETRETIEELSRKWSSKGESSETLFSSLQEIGFTQADIKRFARIGS